MDTKVLDCFPSVVAPCLEPNDSGTISLPRAGRRHGTHTVTAGTREDLEPDRFDEPLAEDGTTEITFDEPGRSPYFCKIHNGPGMTGEVVVE